MDTTNTSGLFKINLRDLFDGVITAVIASVVVVLYGTFTVSDFSIFSADWGSIFQAVVNAATIGFVSYLGNIFISAKNGKILGKI